MVEGQATVVGEVRREVLTAEAVPLSSVQAQLWREQAGRPDLPMWVAHCVELSRDETNGDALGAGELDVARLREASRLAAAELGSGLLRLVTVDGTPHQVLDPTLDADPDYLDLRGEPAPRAAAEAWMRAELDTPDPQLARIAVLRVDDTRYLWFSRFHPTILDGFGAVTLLARAAELYDAAVTGTQARPDRALGPAAIADLERDYEASARRTADAAYWSERLAGAPAGTSLADAAQAAESGPASDPVRTGDDRYVHAERPGMAGLLVDAERRYGTGAAALAASALAAYLARVTGRSDVVLDLPLPARMSAGLRYSGGALENAVPLRLHVAAGATVAELIVDTHQALVGAVQHQRFRFAPDRASRPVGPVLRVALATRVLRLHGQQVELREMSTSAVEDLRVELAERPDGSVRVAFTANPNRYDGAELVRHHRQFTRLFARMLEADPSTEIGDLRIEPRVRLHVV
ncbi:condensation domain-containing protein [Rhodococcus kronopolitis]|uniref:condensation domain-containing protein n=1 Tax=Rhodococcus kronopolitis TaxID=1460226 RepID=UPI0036707166